MRDLENLFIELKSHIQQLENKFIKGYIPADPSLKPSDYSYDVRAFCVLSHAAFEEFIESIVLKVASKSINLWTIDRKTSDVIPCLLCWHGAKFDISGDESDSEKKPYDYLREILGEAKSAFSIMVKNNHGISLKYLRTLLIPVNIELKQDVKILSSLRSLATYRGDYAHNWRAKTPLAPEDAKNHVGDVLDLCDDIRAKAVSKFT